MLMLSCSSSTSNGYILDKVARDVYGRSAAATAKLFYGFYISFYLTGGASSFGFKVGLRVGPAGIAVYGLTGFYYFYSSLGSSALTLVPHFAFAFSKIALTTYYTAVFKSLATLENGSNPV